MSSPTNINTVGHIFENTRSFPTGPLPQKCEEGQTIAREEDAGSLPMLLPIT